MSNQMTFSFMSQSHIQEAAELRHNFKEFGAYSKMNLGFWKAFFDGAVKSKNTIVLAGIDSENKLAGYTIISKNTSKSHRELLLSNGFSLLWNCLKSVVKKPSLLGMLIKNLTFTKQNNEIKKSRWITLFISPNHRRQGLGPKLFGLMSALMYAEGIESFHSPVETQNTPSNKLQEAMGGKLDFVTDIDGLEHNIWIFNSKPLNDDLPCSEEILAKFKHSNDCFFSSIRAILRFTLYANIHRLFFYLIVFGENIIINLKAELNIKLEKSCCYKIILP